jgi:hypothetical protein
MVFVMKSQSSNLERTDRINWGNSVVAKGNGGAKLGGRELRIWRAG